MTNSCKGILANYEVLEVLKQNVLKDINLIKLNTDIAYLDLLKYATTIGDCLGGTI